MLVTSPQESLLHAKVISVITHTLRGLTLKSITRSLLSQEFPGNDRIRQTSGFEPEPLQP